jgi:transposase
MVLCKLAPHNTNMLEMQVLKADDLKGLGPAELTALAAQMLAHIVEQSKHIGEQGKRLDSAQQAIKWRDAKIEKITFELARLKAWRFGAKSERMSAEQRELFAESLAADLASLEAQLAALQPTGSIPESGEPAQKRRPKREPLPDHLPRVDHRVEPENTTCECGQAMQRVGEDVSERLDIIPAQFFVQRQIRGKWACRCCQLMVQEPAAPQVFDNALPTPGLQAHTVISRFVDHLPYYRQEQINARSGVHTPRSTLSAWAGQTGAQLMPVFEAHKDFVLGSRVLHGDETTVALLDPGAGKTKTAYMWAYARGVFDAEPGVVYDFCTGRGSQYPYNFLGAWTGTLVRDGYIGYEKALLLDDRFDAGCMAHSRRKFDELFKANASPVATQAIQRIAWLYRIEADAKDLTAEQRLKMRQDRSRPLCEELHIWLQLERSRVPEGSGIAKAIDYSLNRWAALTRFLLDGDVPIDNNHLENQMRPWGVGRKNWLFVGSELAGERAAMIMSLLQSAKLNKADPWAYLKDVLTRLPTQLNSRIDELLPHRWKPAT